MNEIKELKNNNNDEKKSMSDAIYDKLKDDLASKHYLEVNELKNKIKDNKIEFN